MRFFIGKVGSARVAFPRNERSVSKRCVFFGSGPSGGSRLYKTYNEVIQYLFARGGGDLLSVRCWLLCFLFSPQGGSYIVVGISLRVCVRFDNHKFGGGHAICSSLNVAVP